ncbi:MAG: hypothetical protein DIU69_12815, partial [Bacillota bacterium]
MDGTKAPVSAPPPEITGAVRERIAADPFCRHLGIELEALRPGYARLGMALTPDMLNFHGTAHGGAVFALADAAHAAASNSHGDPAVALHVGLDYVAPARAGCRLVAEAVEEERGRRTALYRLTVREEGTGRLIAAGQGRGDILGRGDGGVGGGGGVPGGG